MAAFPFNNLRLPFVEARYVHASVRLCRAGLLVGGGFGQCFLVRRSRLCDKFLGSGIRSVSLNLWLCLAISGDLSVMLGC